METRTKLKYSAGIIILVCIILIYLKINLPFWFETPLFFSAFVSFFWFQVILVKGVIGLVKGKQKSFLTDEQTKMLDKNFNKTHAFRDGQKILKG